MREYVFGLKHTSICIREEDGRFAGDNGDSVVFIDLFLSPLSAEDGDSGRVVTERTKKRRPSERPFQSDCAIAELVSVGLFAVSPFPRFSDPSLIPLPISGFQP